MRTRSGLLGLLVTVAATALCVLATAPTAFAHAELVASSPADGANLRQPPESATLTFSETVRTPAFVEVTGPGGRDVTVGRVRVRDADLATRLSTSAEPGRYTLSYRVTSADGHPITGTVRFTLAGSANTAEPAPADTATPGAPLPAPAEQTQPAAGSGDGGGGLGTGQVVLLLGVLVVGLVALAAGTRRALRRSVAMVDERKGGRPPGR
jgi:copper resistance protein C